MRYIITGRKISGPPWCYYVGKHGVMTTTGAKANVETLLSEARKELEYWRRTYPAFKWTMERLPARMPVDKAVLHAEEVEG